MQLKYVRISGKCKFKEDGTFKLTLKGRGPWGYYRQAPMYAKAKGRYKLIGDSIISIIEIDKVKASMSQQKECPDFIPRLRNIELDLTYDAFHVKYDSDQVECMAIEYTLIERIMEFWNWRKFPIEIKNDTLKIGKHITMYR